MMAFEEDKLNIEVEKTCMKVLDHYIETVDSETQSFIVEYQGNRAVFDLKNDMYTFDEIKPVIAEYFALPSDVIFFKNEKDEIYLGNIMVLPTLFPFLNSRLKGETPFLRIALKSNMSTLDYILGNEKVKQAMHNEKEELEKVQR